MIKHSRTTEDEKHHRHPDRNIVLDQTAAVSHSLLQNKTMVQTEVMDIKQEMETIQPLTAAPPTQLTGHTTGLMSQAVKEPSAP